MRLSRTTLGAVLLAGVVHALSLLQASYLGEGNGGATPDRRSR